jgi:hypothetical protein
VTTFTDSHDADMQHMLRFSLAGLVHPDTNPLNIVIAYEDFETGKRAKETLDLLAHHLGSACHLANQMWKFEVLTIPKLREIALRDAAQADIVIVSCHGNDLPDHVKNWIEAGLEQSANLLALVGLVDDPSDASPIPSASARKYLATVARRARIEFFAQPRRQQVFFQDPERLPSRQQNAELAQLVWSPFESIAQREVSSPRWGINE